MNEYEFDWYEKASALDKAPAELPASDPGDANPDPITCPVKQHIIASARTVGEMMDAANCHRLEYCEACGQLDGFRRAA